jgi:predicted DNA-binding antitoxin AbrB/MazE fold protein
MHRSCSNAVSRLSSLSLKTSRLDLESSERGRFLISDNKMMKGGLMLVKAIYKNNVLKPLEKLDLKDGDLVEIEVKKNPVDQLYGIIKIQNKQWLDEIIESPDLEPI